MKKLLILFVICLSAVTHLHAQVFPKETLLDNGDPAKRINLVILADGYQATELDKFITDANVIVNNIFSQTPFKEYKNYFNVYAIKVPSNQSGANHPRTSSDSDCTPIAQKTVDNYFGSTFDYGGIHRLLVPTKTALINSVLADNFPMYDQVFVLVNSTFYGGSGGAYATSSTEASSSEVAIHEIGHSFANLADEYWAGAGYAAEKANLTKESDPQKVKWKNWIGTDLIGVYAHAEDPAWFRPHQNCKMRYLNKPFCGVCRETFVERIHQLVNPLTGYSPSESILELQEGELNFSVTLDKPTVNKMSVTWLKNDVAMSSNQNLESITLPVTSFLKGQNTVKAVIIDESPLTRSQSHLTNHVYEVEWTINTDVVIGVEVNSAVKQYEVSVFPNPVEEEINLTYSLPNRSDVSVDVSDATGKTLRNLIKENQSSGKHTSTFQSESLRMDTPGFYYLTLTINNVRVIQKIIHR